MCYALALPPRHYNLPKVVGSTLEKELNKAAEKITSDHTLSLDINKRSGAPTAFTPIKTWRIIEVNSEHRHLTIQQHKFELKKFIANISTSQLQRWLKATGAKQVHQHIKPKPKLSFHHGKERVDSILDQAARGKEWNGGFL